MFLLVITVNSITSLNFKLLYGSTISTPKSLFIAKNLGSQDKLLDVKSILKDDGIVDSMKQIAKNGSLVDVVIFLEEKLNSSL